MLDRRRAGVLLHPTSLPGPGYCGDFGAEARRFVDLIAAMGHCIWQVLPLGPTHDDGCPYQSFSVHAGNPDLIDLQWLVERGWLEQGQAAAGLASRAAKRRALKMATSNFFRQVETDQDSAGVRAYGDFLRDSSYWRENYVRFQAFRSAFD